MLVVDASGAAPAADVWRRYTHSSLWSSWAPQVSGVSGTGDPVVRGDRGWVHGPLLVRVPFTVIDVVPSELRWSWRVGLGPAAVVMEHGVEALDVGSRAWVRIDAPRLLVLPYVPFARFALRRLVRP